MKIVLGIVALLMALVGLATHINSCTFTKYCINKNKETTKASPPLWEITTWSLITKFD